MRSTRSSSRSPPSGKSRSGRFGAGAAGWRSPPALLATLPLLLRRRFPFGAPVFVFAALAALSLVRSGGRRGRDDRDPCSCLLLAFWIAGAHDERRAGGRRVGRRPREPRRSLARKRRPSRARRPADSGRPVNIGIFDLELCSSSLGAGALARPPTPCSAAPGVRSRSRQRAARLEHEREEARPRRGRRGASGGSRATSTT